MAKKKAVAQEPIKKRMGRPPKLEGKKTEGIHFRMSPAYEQWLAGYAKNRRCERATLMDQALAKLAELDGYEAPPDR
jgi:hypothetical protein